MVIQHIEDMLELEAIKLLVKRGEDYPENYGTDSMKTHIQHKIESIITNKLGFKPIIDYFNEVPESERDTMPFLKAYLAKMEEETRETFEPRKAYHKFINSFEEVD
jgi:hypothetical protein